MTPQWENDKRDLGLELYKHIANKDKNMAYQIYMYMLKEKYITPEEAVQVKEDLDKTFMDDETSTTPEANKIMLAITKQIGISEAKVLWRLINQFPYRLIGDPANGEFYPDNKVIIKQSGIPSVSYYELVNKLIARGYISKRKEKKLVVYKIEFKKIMDDAKHE